MLLDEAREEFPRLYFLSDKELVELLSVSRNPQALMPFAKKCFHGVHSLTYALPVDLANSAMSSLDFTLNGKMLSFELIFVRIRVLFVHVASSPGHVKFFKKLNNFIVFSG